MVLGWIGFDESFRTLGQPSTFLDNLYLSLQLLVLQSGAVAPPVPWQLEVARLLAPAVAAYATLIALAALLGEQVSSVRARMHSDHVVVCGLGRLGAVLAKALRAAGYEVVAIESDPRNAAIGECREEGVLVLIGDATDRSLLRRTGVERARFLFAVAGDDEANTGIALDARTLLGERKGRPLTCFVHIADPKLGRVLRQLGVAQHGGDPFRLETFSAAERGAPALLREHAAFDDEGRTPIGPPHLLVIGMGEMGGNLVVTAARRWRSIPGIGDRRFKVTVVDHKAVEHVAAISERYLRLRSACDLVARPMELDSAEFERADFLFDAKGACDVTRVYVCMGDDATGLSAALHLRHRLGDSDVPIVVRTTQEMGVAALIGGLAGRDRHGGLEVFGLLDLISRPDLLLRGQNEVLARAIHERYLRQARLKGQASDADRALVDWEELPESLRESNRRQAADISRKLGAIGCDLEPLTDWDAPPFALGPDEVELLARMEHESWLRERETAGWRHAPEKNEARRESPYMVPYDELTEDGRDLDRDTVRAMPALLAEIDFAIVRRHRAGA
ncbi:MAG: NAD-binding protein [Candidatus Limnocylindrales bacterium]